MAKGGWMYHLKRRYSDSRFATVQVDWLTSIYIHRPASQNSSGLQVNSLLLLQLPNKKSAREILLTSQEFRKASCLITLCPLVTFSEKKNFPSLHPV